MHIQESETIYILNKTLFVNTKFNNVLNVMIYFIDI